MHACASDKSQRSRNSRSSCFCETNPIATYDRQRASPPSAKDSVLGGQGLPQRRINYWICLISAIVLRTSRINSCIRRRSAFALLV